MSTLINVRYLSSFIKLEDVFIPLSQDCQDNTAGLQCEICAPGYYGDATQGTSEDCKKCACPLAQPQNK